MHGSRAYLYSPWYMLVFWIDFWQFDNCVSVPVCGIYTSKPLPHWISQNTTVGNVKIGPTTSSIQGLYTYVIAGRAASQVWLGIGGQGIDLRAWVPGSIPGGHHHFLWCQFQIKWDRLEREDGEKVLGLTPLTCGPYWYPWVATSKSRKLKISWLNVSTVTLTSNWCMPLYNIQLGIFMINNQD